MTQAHSVLDFALSINPQDGNGCCLLKSGLCVKSSYIHNHTYLIQKQGKPSKYLGTSLARDGASAPGLEPFGAEIGG